MDECKFVFSSAFFFPSLEGAMGEPSRLERELERWFYSRAGVSGWSMYCARHVLPHSSFLIICQLVGPLNAL